MPSGVLLDIDGVLTVSWRPLPGAVDAIRWLRNQAVPFRLVTNTSSKSRQQIADLLAAAGMEVDVSQILTAVSSAAHYLAEHHSGVGCLVINEGDLGQDLRGVTTVDAESAGVVLLGGAGPSVGYAQLDAVFKRAIEGVPVIALHRNARYQTAEGPALDMGAFVVGLEAAAGIEISVVGKPAETFFQAAVDDLGIAREDTVMVGDDIGADVNGAQGAGIVGILVRTGKFRPSDLDGDMAPDHVIDDIGALPSLLDHLR